MKKMNLYFGLLFFVVFLFTGYYMVNNILPHYADDPYIRMANRADHIYMLFIALLNIISYKCVFSNRIRVFEPISRILLIVAGICSAIGFFVENAAVLDGRMITPTAVGLAFLAVVIFGIGELVGRNKTQSN